MEGEIILGLIGLLVLAFLVIAFLTRELRFERNHNRRLHGHLERAEAVAAKHVEAIDEIGDMFREGVHVPPGCTLRFAGDDGSVRETGIEPGVYFFAQRREDPKKEIKRAVAEELLKRGEELMKRTHLTVVDGGDKPGGAA